MTTQLRESWTPTSGDLDDDLLHTVCESCSRILCDGSEAVDVTYAEPVDEVLCAVCEDLDESLSACPYCGASPP